MALKFQIHDITNKLVYKFYPYVEIQETKRIKAIGQIFFKIQHKRRRDFPVIQTAKMYT